jgi:type II secretory pathway predicted ATPase ExeA/septal ring-binding cell division protein DamX
MYYTFFGLQQAPFKITPDTDVFFEGGNRGAILEALIYAITNGEGIIKVTGEVGSGKTMLCRVLQTRLPPHIETVYLANPSVSPEEILHAIAFELQLPITRTASRLEVMHALNAYLLERHAQQKQVVVFVEESQGMPIPTLEEIRLLSNLETQQYKLLQIVLFGQPEFDENLRQPQIRQLRERITHSFDLAPLDEDDVRAYLSFRLHAAGYHGPDLFSHRVIAYLTRASGGLTRRINLVADKALLAAFAESTHNVSLKHVKAAVRDSEFSDIPATRSLNPLTYAAGGVLVGGVLGVMVFAGYQAWFSPRAQVVPETAAATASGAATQPLPAVPMATATPEPAATASVAANQPLPAVPVATAMPEPAATASGAANQPLPAVPVATAMPEPAAAATAPQQTSTAFVQATPSHPAVLSETAEDLLEQRLRATDAWLAQQRPLSYSIQLLGSEDPELLRDYFKTMAKHLEIENVYVYRTIANQRPSLTVLYGEFSTRGEVYQALENLPDELKVNQPYYRTIQGVRSEIARHGL